MKTETYTITDAFAWDKSVLMKTLMKENNRSWIAFGADLSKVIDNADLTYYSDAVKMAIAAYAMEKKLVFDKTIKIIMTVKTKDGADHPYNMRAGRFSPTEYGSMDDIQQELAKPGAIALGSVAARKSRSPMWTPCLATSKKSRNSHG